MTLLDYFAQKLGYVKAPEMQSEPNIAITESAYSIDLQKVEVDWIPTPAYFGYSEDVTFKVMRGGMESSHPASFAEVLDFVDACGYDHSSNEITLAMVLCGIPFEIDGAEMRFIPISH